MQFRGPSGNNAYSMKCSGAGRTMEACYRKAGEICPSGYNVVDRSDGGMAFIGNVAGRVGQTLVVECRA